MKTPLEILEYVGRGAAQAALGVSADRIRVACTQNKLPAAWLDALECLAKMPLPREAFNFKGAGK